MYCANWFILFSNALKPADNSHLILSNDVFISSGNVAGTFNWTKAREFSASFCSADTLSGPSLGLGVHYVQIYRLCMILYNLVFLKG